MKTESGGGGSPNNCCLIATALGHLKSQCSAIGSNVIDSYVELVGIGLKKLSVTDS